MMRRIAVVGDQLGPYGGQVVGYEGHPAFFHGHQPALIGGQAYCAHCKSAGTIAKSGGPRRMQFMGEIALDGDIVLCKCPTPPRILATLAGEAWYEDFGSGDGVSKGSSLAASIGEQVAAILIGALAGTVGGLLAAQAVPKCGEDCFAVVGAFVVGGGLVGALAFGVAGIGLTEMNWHRRALALVSLTLTLILIATLMTSRHYSQMHDPQDSLPFAQPGKQ